MRNFLTKYKSAIILLVIILIGFWLYSLFFPQLKQVFQSNNSGVVGEELFTTLNTIESLSLNDAIFDNPDYLRLRDQETVINAQRAGRSNPFAPTGSDVGGTLREPAQQVKSISNTETFLEIDMEDILEGEDVTATSSPAE
tara:strand:+ start:77 stop:499 length:423 start_codon:yes stop_codon:yes gene_type:complete